MDEKEQETFVIDEKDVDISGQTEVKEQQKERAKQKKAEKHAEELKKLQAEVESYKLMALRAQADFDNYRKRNADLTSKCRTEGKTEVILAILPVLDNFERADAMISDEKSKEGVQKIIRQFQTVLEKLGVAEIEAEGCEFNPDLHNAVITAEVEGVKEGQVLEVLQKGYTLDGKVIRYSMVKVSS